MNIEEKSDRLTNVTTDIVMGNTTAEIPDLSDVVITIYRFNNTV